MFNKNRALFMKDIIMTMTDVTYMHMCMWGNCGHANSVKEDNMSKDEKTLNILLVHWVNHNKSHEEGFREWVDKAKEMGKTETAEYIEKAIDICNKLMKCY